MGLATRPGRGRPGRRRLHAGRATNSRRVGLTCGAHGAQQRPRTRGVSGWGGHRTGAIPTRTCFRRLGNRRPSSAQCSGGRGAGVPPPRRDHRRRTTNVSSVADRTCIAVSRATPPLGRTDRSSPRPSTTRPLLTPAGTPQRRSQLPGHEQRSWQAPPKATRHRSAWSASATGHYLRQSRAPVRWGIARPPLSAASCGAARATTSGPARHTPGRTGRGRSAGVRARRRAARASRAAPRCAR